MKLIKGMFKFGLYFFIFCVIMGVIMTVVSGGEETSAPTETETKAEAKEETKKEEAPKTFSIGEEVKVGDVTFKVNGTETAQNVGGEYGENAKGTYLIVNVTVRNDGSEAITTDSSFFKLKAGGKTYEAETLATLYANDSSDFFYQSINPDIELTGSIAFDVSESVVGAEDLQLNVQTGFFGTEQGQIELK